jgi:hypothetical protein
MGMNRVCIHYTLKKIKIRRREMQIDMHFYGVFALARAAGLQDETAKTIAYASQFVDDAVEDDIVLMEDRCCIIPSMTSHKPLDYQNSLPGDQWKVWVPFHFLPGNESEDGDFVERMVCRKNSKVAQTMCNYALDPKHEEYWPHMIGIAAHVYADTFAHYGFVGFSHAWNKVISGTIEPKTDSKSILRYIKAKFEQFKTRITSGAAELIPVGHGSVATYPDRPYLKWEYEYESDFHPHKKIKRDNRDDFMEGAESLFTFFCKFADISHRYRGSNGSKKWDDIKKEVKNIIHLEGPRDTRVKRWKAALNEMVFSEATEIDKTISYDKDAWDVHKLRYFSHDIKEGDPYKFIKAAKHYRLYVLEELLPQFKLVIH